LTETFPAEKLLSKVLADFLPYIVLVGGWVPFKKISVAAEGSDKFIRKVRFAVD
jgi:hypothetical protein